MLFESETSPPPVDSDSDLEQPPLTYNQSQVNGILMVSPPEAESDEESSSLNKITLLENDEFHTPPEHHNHRSTSSSQEFLSQREKPVAEAVTDEHIQQTACVDEGIQLEGGENLGVPVTQELKGSDEALGTNCSENVIHVDRVVGFEAKLKRYMVLRDELGEHISKKIRVSKENRDCDTLFPSETGIDDQVHCTEGLVFNKGKATEHGGSSVKDFGGISANGGLSVKAGPKSLYVGSYAGPEERKEENAAVEEDRVLPCSRDISDFAPGKLIGSLKDVKNKGKSVTYIDLTAMDSDDNGGISIEDRLNKKAVEVDSVEPCSVYNLDSAPGKTIGGNKDSKNEGISSKNLDSLEENCGISMHSEGLENVTIAMFDCETKRMEGTGKFNDCNVVEKKRVDDKCSMGSEDLSRKSYVKKTTKVVAMKNLQDHVHDDIQKDGESSSGMKNTKEIESFRYEGCPSDGKYISKMGISMVRTEVTCEPRNPKGKKRSWKELMEACEVFFNKMDQSSEDVDFLETAKKRGLTFP